MDRLLQLIPILLELLILTFALLYIAPGDPAQRPLTSNGVVVSQELLDELRHEMGLDRPFGAQYGTWLLKLLCGDMGISYQDEVEVAKKLGDVFKYTLVLSSVSMGFSIAIVLPIEIYTAIRQDSMMDNIIRILSFIGKLELSRELGIAIVFVSHDLSLTCNFCKNVLVMYQGGCVETGSTIDNTRKSKTLIY